MPFKHHIFVCTNQRPPTSERGCCLSKGSEDVFRAFQAQVRDLGLKGIVRANKAGCLDACEYGVTVVVYPDAVWYGGVKVEDVTEIMQQHILGGEPVERLEIVFQSKPMQIALPPPSQQ